MKYIISTQMNSNFVIYFESNSVCLSVTLSWLNCITDLVEIYNGDLLILEQGHDKAIIFRDN